MDSCSFGSVYPPFGLEVGSAAYRFFWEDYLAEKKKDLHAHWPLHPPSGAHTAG
jgi:hypothetical protein